MFDGVARELRATRTRDGRVAGLFGGIDREPLNGRADGHRRIRPTSPLTQPLRWVGRSDGEDLVRLRGWEDTSPMDRLDQLRARSEHEIEAHAGDLHGTYPGRYMLDEAAELLASLRLWAQVQDRTDAAAREVLEALDGFALLDVARELQATGTPEGQIAGRSLVAIAGRPSRELMAVARYALRAL